MSDPVVDDLARVCVGTVRAAAPMAELTTLRVGGTARVLVVAEVDGDLAAVGRVCRAHELPWAVVGRGSNLLVSDDGWPGVVVTLGRGYRGMRVDDELVHAGAAEPLPSLAVRVADQGLSGFAWACAVPGTLGGAVRMNAGAHGGEMSRCLVEVEVWRLRARTRESWPVAALGLRYRHSELPDDAVVLGASLRLLPADAAAIRDEITSIRRWRREHQPLSQPNCGSVFTNPPGGSAGALIDEAGCKGLRVGGAHISERHANFIVTSPDARARDVASLIETVRARVLERAGIELVPEVRRLGDITIGDAVPGGRR